jgi:HNH endonuclease
MKYGKPKPLPELSDLDRVRVWQRVSQRGPDECWPWTGSKHTRGYGRYSLYRGKRNGASYWRVLRATRVIYFLTTGYDPGFAEVLHTCDNPQCCNPKHLRAGTHRENMDDMVNRGRVAVGQNNGRAKLLDAQVAEIRKISSAEALYSERHALAKRYGVSVVVINNVLKCKWYKHVV